MQVSTIGSESPPLPDNQFMSPDNRLPPTVEPLSTKRERMEIRAASRLGDADERHFSRMVRSAPTIQRRRITSRAHAICFSTPPNTSNQPSPVESENAFCKTDHECVSIPIESPHYNISKRATYFDQCFVIEKKLGEGSFGEVFQAKSREDSLIYAVKRAIESYKSTADRAIKLREVQKHEELTPHPNLVYFNRAWEERGRLYIQTELCTTSLADYCKYYVPPISEIWDIFYDLINATDYLHSKDLIHLDIKPENVFLTDKKVCKLGDFGLMFDLKHDNPSLVEDGDSKYLAPEVLNARPTRAADIFSIGMSMLEVSTNLDLPTAGEHWHALRSGDVPQRFLKMLTADLRRLILWMIDPSADRRPTTKQLIDDPVVQWPFRFAAMEMRQKVRAMLLKYFFLFYSILALLSLSNFDMFRVGEMIADTRRKRTREEVAEQKESSTPERKRCRLETIDSTYSDEGTVTNTGKDSRDQFASEHHAIDQSNDASAVLHPSLSPFREDDENRERWAKQRMREERTGSPTSFVSPATPLLHHAASAPILGSRRSQRTLESPR
ncbi:hypothetical protein PENTCL1PPCAC_24427, partial [Pristionchus entomophagus]